MSAELTRQVLSAVDANDTGVLAPLFAPDARMVFGNGEPLVGRDAIVGGVAYFATTITGLRHEVVREWYTDTDTGVDAIVESAVTFTRHDGKTVTVPAAAIYHADTTDGLIDNYRVYFDLAPVYASA